MVVSPSSGESIPQEDQITNLNEGPWPGPIERLVVLGEIHFGKHHLTKLFEIKVKKHRQGGLWYRTATALISPQVAEEKGWDYGEEVVILERGQQLFRGVCLEGKRLRDGSLALSFRDGSFELTYRTLNASLFGMTNKEMMFWIPQFAGMPEPNIQGFTPDREPRLYIVRINGTQ